MKTIEGLKGFSMEMEGITEDFRTSPDLQTRSELKELESKYLTAIKKLIDKYESLYNLHDNYKGEMAEKLNHYIALNNSLYSRNTELGLINKEKNDSLNRMIKENLGLKSELESRRLSAEKLKNQLSEASSLIQLNEKFIENMKGLYAQKEEEVSKWRGEFSSLEQKYRDEKSQMSLHRNSWMDKAVRLEETLSRERRETQEALNEVKTQLENHSQIKLELERALVESNAKLASVLYENEGLRRSLEDKTLLIEELSVVQEQLTRSVKENERTKEFHFEGTIVNGKKQGKGVFRCPDWNYEGEFKDDLPCGKGKLVLKCPAKTLEGEFDHNGHFLGTKAFFPGFTYNGGIVGNKLEGKGYIEVANQFIIEARFAEDRLCFKECAIIIDLNTGEEHEAIVGKNGMSVMCKQEKTRIEIDFDKGIATKIKSK